MYMFFTLFYYFSDFKSVKKVYPYEESALFLLILTVFLVRVHFFHLVNSGKKVYLEKKSENKMWKKCTRKQNSEKKCEKKVWKKCTRKQIVKKKCEKSVPGKKKWKKVWKKVWKKCTWKKMSENKLKKMYLEKE